MADDETISGGSDGEELKALKQESEDAIVDEYVVKPADSIMSSLPTCVKRRVKALKKLQKQTAEIEAEFYAEVQQLECKYASLYEPIYDKRNAIVNGQLEPSEEDCDWKDAHDEIGDISGDLSNKMKLEDVNEKNDIVTPVEQLQDVTGIPDFWFNALNNAELIAEMIQEYDVPVLKHLQNIRVKLEITNFTLEFIFSKNPYFTNEILTKQYVMRVEPMSEDPLSYEGPEIVSCKGCTINWNQGKNVTVKVVKKVQKHKGRGTRRTVTQTVQRDSFFNFFSPPEVKEEEELDDETEQLLALDFEIGHFIRERIVPRAVLYYTGEINDNIGEFDDEDLEDAEDDDEEEEDEETESPGSSPKHDTEKPECKQQ